jgi:hypothetical protein
MLRLYIFFVLLFIAGYYTHDYLEQTTPVDIIIIQPHQQYVIPDDTNFTQVVTKTKDGAGIRMVKK